MLKTIADCLLWCSYLIITRFTKKHEYVVNELLDTEKKYIDQMKIGLESYTRIFDEVDLPKPLKGKKDVMFQCLENVLDFHDGTFYSILEEKSDRISELLHAISEQISVSCGGY